MPNADPSKGQIEGVDSSHWQGRVFPLIGKHQFNIDWWAIKATEGLTYVDPRFKSTQEQLRLANIKYRGFYHFPRGDKSIKDQVAHFVKTVGPLQIGEFAKLDDEKCEPLGYGLTIKQAAEWLARVEDFYGRPCCEYTGAFYKHPTDNRYHWDAEEIRMSTLGGERPNILPSYNSWSKVTTRGKPVHVWQWTSVATLDQFPGLFDPAPASVGRIDRDLVFLPQAYDKACGYGDVPPPVIVVDPPVIVHPPHPNSPIQEIDIVPALSQPGLIQDTHSDPGRKLNPGEVFRIDLGGPPCDIFVAITVTETEGVGNLCAAGDAGVDAGVSCLNWNGPNESVATGFRTFCNDGGLYIRLNGSAAHVLVALEAQQ